MKVTPIKRAIVATLAVFALSQPLYAADETKDEDTSNKQAEQAKHDEAASETASTKGVSAFAVGIGAAIAAVLAAVGSGGGDNHSATTHHGP